MKKIVYLIEQPLDERNYDRFGIQTWIDRGWDVEVWDLTPIAHPGVWKGFAGSGRPLREFEGYFPIASRSQLRQRCSRFRQIEYFIDQTGDNYYATRTKLHLIRAGATRVIYASGTMPEPEDSTRTRVVSRLKKAVRRDPIHLFKRLRDAVLRRLAAPYTRPGLVVVCGEKSIPSAQRGCEILEAHNLDYDIFLRLAKSTCTSTGEYAVFIDQDYCFHPDFIFQGIPLLVTPAKYFPAVCNGLRTMARALTVDVRVAAHPRASYQMRVPDYFEAIPIEYGRTAELIRDCKLVVCHNSTAIQFAVLFGKPLVFMTTDELNASYAGHLIARFASELGKSVINLDGNLEAVDWQRELSVDLKRYAEYRNKYIKIDGSPDVPHWEIVINHIEKTGRRASVQISRLDPT